MAKTLKRRCPTIIAFPPEISNASLGLWFVDKQKVVLDVMEG